MCQPVPDNSTKVLGPHHLAVDDPLSYVRTLARLRPRGHMAIAEALWDEEMGLPQAYMGTFGVA